MFEAFPFIFNDVVNLIREIFLDIVLSILHMLIHGVWII